MKALWPPGGGGINGQPPHLEGPTTIMTPRSTCMILPPLSIWLAGESASVPKSLDPVDEGSRIQSKTNMVFSGTMVRSLRWEVVCLEAYLTYRHGSGGGREGRLLRHV